jgi:hypothetical protein
LKEKALQGLKRGLEGMAQVDPKGSTIQMSINW